MAQILERRIKGDLGLDELTEVCGIIQNISVCKLIRISRKTDEPEGKFNLALFEKVNLSDIVPKPLLIEVNDGSEVAEIVAEQVASGKKFVFDSTIFVGDKNARVLGFR